MAQEPTPAEETPKRLRALSLPARRNVATNAYTALMASALEAADVAVDDFSPGQAVLARYDIVHIHWPHGYAHGRSSLAAWLRSLMLIATLAWQKLRGAKLVWTVHDYEDTIGARPLLQRLIMSGVDRLTDGLIFLSESSRAATYAARPAYRKKRTCITLHGVYGEAYPRRDRIAARRALGVDPEARIAAYVGDMKPYKGLADLLDAYIAMGEDAPPLLVAGAASDPAFDREIRARMQALLAAGAPIVWLDKRLSNEEMADAMAACDLILAPYRVSWNSGIATLALEHERPLLCRDAPIFRELQDEVGEGWVRVYQAPISADAIKEALAAGAPNAATLGPFLERRAWTPIARVIADFYKSLCAQ